MPTKCIQRRPERPQDRLIALARKQGMFRSRDLDAAGLSRTLLQRLVREGLLTRRARGVYALTDAPFTEYDTLAEVSTRVPHGVICLLSALHFHGLTTQNPPEVWIAIDHKARAPRTPELPLRVVRFSGPARTKGIDHHRMQGVSVPIYNPAKTVADCFKFRQKIGLDIAIEALRECLHERRATIDKLWYYAEICRVRNVMRPYLESLTADQL